MNKKEESEFNSLKTVKEKAQWLLEKGVTSKLTWLAEKGKICHAAYSAGIMLPGGYDSKAEAIAGGTAFLARKAKFGKSEDEEK